MINLSLKQFEEFANDYSTVPLTLDVLADHQTPISLALKLEGYGGKYFLLESVEGGEEWGRYSIVGFNIHREIKIENDRALITNAKTVQELSGNPIDAIQSYLSRFNVAPVPNLPPFSGGVVGYLSFETVRYFERFGDRKPASASFPDAYFVIVDQLAVFDNVNKTVKLICCVHINDHDSKEDAFLHGQKALCLLEKILIEPLPTIHAPVNRDSSQPAGALPTFNSNVTRADYEKMVARAKQYIYDGDIIQVVLAQHFKSRITASHFDIYRALRFINPSPYLYFIKIDNNKSIAGSSPEVMVRFFAPKAEIRPIAGTRHRGSDHSDDLRLAEELLADPKERAEHVMLVDLARNDLGRVAETGSVIVKDYMTIEKYSHVMHIVSRVEATIKKPYDAIDVLKATFPAGTLSGAPKVRAMEIIRELEPISRGPYGGALGYISYGCRHMDTAITIRTIVMENSTAVVTAGAGIVCDSKPDREYLETIDKSNGMLRALELAQNGLRLESQG